jgi:OmcA/MtrC family decaheme c-type cytochrome
MNSKLVRLGLAALMIGTLAGCGGGSDGATGAVGAAGAPGTPGSPGTPGAPGQDATGTVNTTTLSAADWTALKPQIDPASISVTINSPPEVTFKVTDQYGNPIVGLGGQSKSATALTPKNYNFFFTLAKLMPGTMSSVTSGGITTTYNAEPSKWVSYLVTKPTAATNGVVTAWAGTYPTPEQEGTLVDNGDGTYTYTFLRDITQAASIVAGLTDDATHVKADLDPAELTYDPTATHRLGIAIQGSQPGTGTNTPTAVQTTTPVPLVNTFNIGYDFVPNGGTVTATRDIVTKDSCSGCHDGKGIGHVSTTNPNPSNPTASANGVPPGAFVGRNDPKLCVTCHTDQTKYGFANVTEGTNVDGSPALTSKYYRTTTGEAAFTYPRMIHQTHMGEDLVKTGYNLNGHCNFPGQIGYDATKAISNPGQCYGLVGFPQDQRNCTKCHDGSATKSDGTTNLNKTANGDNWKNNPNMLACGACHDGINFATGTGITLEDRDADLAAKVPVGTTHSGHTGGARADNTLCSSCHTPDVIAEYHQTNTSTLNNPVAGAWLNGVTHTVSTIAYDIKSVTVNASKQPVITFKVTMDKGLPDEAIVTSLAVPTLVANVSIPGSSGGNGVGALEVDPNFEPIPGFAGGPCLYAVYAVPQDGITAPSDFNSYQCVSLANLLIASGSPKGGSLSNTVSGGAYQADANGYFTATLTGDTVGQPVTASCLQNTGSSAITGNCVNPSPIVIPTTAKMVTGALIGTFTQKNVPDYPYTPAVVSNAAAKKVNAAGGVIVKSMLKKLVATGYTARRVIADVAKCNNCHDQLGTSPEFHGGARNDPTACSICHNANRVNAGWSVDASTYIHGIHGGSKRTVAYTWNTDWSTLLYPGLLKDCNQCHVPGAVNFSKGDSAAAAPNMLWSTVATGSSSAGANTSPYITTGYNYGNGFTYTPEGAIVATYTPSNGSGGAGSAVAAHVAGAGGEIVPAQSTTLVNSPIASACFSCHDNTPAMAHIRLNGGALYAPRSSTSIVPSSEACLVCHGAGRTEDVVVVHQQ